MLGNHHYDGVSAVFDTRFEDRARALVQAAWTQIEKGYPGNPKVHAERMTRADRVRRAFRDKEFLVSLVAQWLTSRGRIAERSNVVKVAEARAAADRIAALAEEVTQLQREMTALADGLRIMVQTEEGEDLVCYADFAAMALSEALPSLMRAQDPALEVRRLLPDDPKGTSGMVGKLRRCPPDRALAEALAVEWLRHGLTLAGGDANGHGIDIFLVAIIGEKNAETELAHVRKLYGGTPKGKDVFAPVNKNPPQGIEEK
jgi:hypothetical protein